MTCFEDLSDDLLYQILQHTYSERSYTLHTFRLASKRMNYFAESVLYRHITLQDDDQHEFTSYRFIERLSNPHDALCQHVRSLDVKSFKGDDNSYCMNTRLLSACLKNIRKLEVISWDSDVVLAKDLLNTFYQCAQEVQLGIAITAIYLTAIRSQQLTRLSISLPYSHFPTPESSCLLKQLKNEILLCHNLRSLSLDVHLDPSARPPLDVKHLEARASRRCDSSSVTWTRTYRNISGPFNTIQLPLENGDRLPPLEELDIRTKMYKLDMKHCKDLCVSLDLGWLKRLRLGQIDPAPFFQVIMGQVPQLELLDFTYHENTRFGDESNLWTCVEFIASISALRELVVRWEKIKQPSTFWWTLKDAHAPHLRYLSVQAFQRGWEAPNHESDLKWRLEELSSLETLKVALRSDGLNYIPCTFCSWQGHALNTSYVEMIPIIPSLKSLQVSVRCHTSDRPLFSYIVDHAHCVIRRVWTTYSNDSQACELESFSLTFWRWEASNLHIDDELGFPRSAHIDTIIFDSVLTRDGLIIRPRGHPHFRTVFYNQVWQETGGLGTQVTYLAEAKGGEAPPLVVGSRFHQMRGIRNAGYWGDLHMGAI